MFWRRNKTKSIIARAVERTPTSQKCDLLFPKSTGGFDTVEVQMYDVSALGIGFLSPIPYEPATEFYIHDIGGEQHFVVIFSKHHENGYLVGCQLLGEVAERPIRLMESVQRSLRDF